MSPKSSIDVSASSSSSKWERQNTFVTLERMTGWHAQTVASIFFLRIPSLSLADLSDRGRLPASRSSPNSAINGPNLMPTFQFPIHRSTQHVHQDPTQPLWMKQRREGEECSSQLALPLPRARLLRTCTRVRLLPFGNGGISAALSDGSYVGRGVRLPVRSHHHASDKYLLSVLRTTPEDSMIVDLCVGT